LAFAFTFTSDETFVTPCVSRASAMARPTWPAESAEPFRVTSPLLAETSIIAFDVSESAWSLPFTIVSITLSSVLPVGAPTTLSLVRTIATPRSRSAWSSVSPSRHSVMRVLMSVPVVAAAMSVELLLVPLIEVAPVWLVEPLVAPIVL
jgi:hypothetical protein